VSLQELQMVAAAGGASTSRCQFALSRGKLRGDGVRAAAAENAAAGSAAVEAGAYTCPLFSST
jgi:hypothetical protein